MTEQNYKELDACPAGYDCRGMMQTKAEVAAKDCINIESCAKQAGVSPHGTFRDIVAPRGGFADIFDEIFSSYDRDSQT